jgi:methionine synthase I (cobalamin-dependent)
MSTAAARRRSLSRSVYARLTAALAAQRCLILDGAAATHRRHVQAGCNILRTHTRGLLSPTGRRHPHWIEFARRGVRSARTAIAEHGRRDDAAVAFSIDAEIDVPDTAATIDLVGRALADEPPDLVLVEGLAVLRPTLESTVAALLALDLPVWLSFRRCRDGLCGADGRHWGGHEGDAFGRAARRFEELGVGALLLGCIPPDHVDGTLSYLRDFTDLPLGVTPNLGYPTSDGWRSDANSDDHYARAAMRWREEGAQIIGGCCGVGPGQIALAREALAGTRPGRPRVLEVRRRLSGPRAE